MSKPTGLSDSAAKDLSKTLLYKMATYGRNQMEAEEKLGKHNIRATTSVIDEEGLQTVRLNIFWRDIEEGIGASVTSYNEILNGKIQIVSDTYELNVIQANGSQHSPDKMLTPDEMEILVADKYLSKALVPIRRALQVLRFLELDLKAQIESQSIYQAPEVTGVDSGVLSKVTNDLMAKMVVAGSLQPRAKVGVERGIEAVEVEVLSKFIVDEGRDRFSLTMNFMTLEVDVSIEGRYEIHSGVPRVVPFYYWVVLLRNGERTIFRPTTTVGVNGSICASNEEALTKPIQQCLELLQSVERELRKQFES